MIGAWRLLLATGLLASGTSGCMGGALAGAGAKATAGPLAARPGGVGPTLAPRAEATKAPLWPTTEASPRPNDGPTAPLRGVLRVPPLSVIGAGDGLISDHGGGVVSNNGGGVVSNNGGGLVSNNGAAIISDSGSAFRLAGGRPAIASWHLLELAETAQARASVVLEGLDGQPLGISTATDAEGAFELAAPPAGPFVVKASFAIMGQAFRFATVVVASEPGAADLDVASTLVAEKLLSLGPAARPALAARPLAKLRSALRQRLAAGLVPDMRPESRDRVAAFDQLVLDEPDVASAVRAIAGAEAPQRAWRVDTVVDNALFIDAGLSTPVELGFTGTGTFTVDAQERLVMVLPRRPLRVVRLTPGERAPEVIGTLPAEAAPPVRVLQAPDGQVAVVAVDPARRTHALYRQRPAGFERELASFGVLLDGDEGFEALGGRMVLDAGGTLYYTQPFRHVVMRLRPGAASPEVVAGASGQPGYADGPAAEARFNAPQNVALAPDGAVLVADSANNAIRRVGPDGAVTTLAGVPGEPTYRNGRRRFARFGAVEGLALGDEGEIFVTDRGSRRVRLLSRDGSVFLVAFDGRAGHADGEGPKASCELISALERGPSGALYVRDYAPSGKLTVSNGYIRRIRPVSSK